MKVVCVDDRPNETSGDFTYPNGYIVAGEAYTVARVFDEFVGATYDLVEKPFIPKPHIKVFGYWLSRRFVPLEYYRAEFCVSTDLSIPTTNPHPLPLGLIRASSGFQRQLSF